jgi:ABC-2 type transport system ATP-binding protein
VIEVSDLSKSFGPVQALDRVSFDVGEGEILGFLGPNGAGKSTTMRILTGFMPGDSGRVRVAGHDVARNSLAVRQATGYLPEGVPVYPEMRVGEYLRYRARLKGIARRARKLAVDEALTTAGVFELARRVIGTLSRGYRQRVGLADALVGKPPVLILDEPTVGLDPEQVRQFRQTLHDVGQDRTVILSTHILSEVELVCSSVAIIQTGRIVARGTAEKLRQRAGASRRVLAEIAGPQDKVRQALEADSRVTGVSVEPVADREGDSNGAYHCFALDVLTDCDMREQVFQAVQAGGWKLRHLTQEELPLEDIFVSLVGKLAAGGDSE